jgi:hypothetical protein
VDFSLNSEDKNKERINAYPSEETSFFQKNIDNSNIISKNFDPSSNYDVLSTNNDTGMIK